jgi:hypothetical protein
LEERVEVIYLVVWGGFVCGLGRDGEFVDTYIYISIFRRSMESAYRIANTVAGLELMNQQGRGIPNMRLV